MSRSLRYFTYYEFLARMYFHVPVLVLFFLHHKAIPVEKVGWLYGAFAVTTLIMEVPAGWLADRWGHRNVLGAGGLLQATGLLILILGEGFPMMMVGEVTFAVGETFLSGITYAYLYELTVKFNVASRYPFWQRKAASAVILAALLAGVPGSFIYDVNPYLPFILSVAVNTAGAVAVFFFPRVPRVVSLKKQLFPLKELQKDLLVWLFVNGVIFSMTINFRVAVFQVLLEEIYVPEKWFGPIISGSMAVAFLVTNYYHLIEKRLSSEKGAFYIPVIMFLCTIIIVSFPDLTIPAGILLGVSGILHRPLTLGIIQQRISSERRSTILSWSSFFGGAVSVLFYSIWVVWGEDFSGRVLLIELGFLFLTCQVLLLWSRYRNSAIGFF